MGQTPALTAGDLGMGKDIGRLGRARSDPVTGARQNADWKGLHDRLPVFPEMKLRQIIRPHEPDKPHTGVTRSDRAGAFAKAALAALAIIPAKNARLEKLFNITRHVNL